MQAFSFDDRDVDFQKVFLFILMYSIQISRSLYNFTKSSSPLSCVCLFEMNLTVKESFVKSRTPLFNAHTDSNSSVSILFILILSQKVERRTAVLKRIAFLIDKTAFSWQCICNSDKNQQFRFKYWQSLSLKVFF